MSDKLKPNIEVLEKEKIETALSKVYRQYLTGHLEREQPYLNHIDDDIEIGISYYKEFTADKPHVHSMATEHTYILQGAIRVKLLDGSDKEFEFNAGDFFLLHTGVPYAVKNRADTKILFIKSPGINDKKLVEVPDNVKKWLSKWDADDNI